MDNNIVQKYISYTLLLIIVLCSCSKRDFSNSNNTSNPLERWHKSRNRSRVLMDNIKEQPQIVQSLLQSILIKNKEKARFIVFESGSGGRGVPIKIDIYIILNSEDYLPYSMTGKMYYFKNPSAFKCILHTIVVDNDEYCNLINGVNGLKLSNPYCEYNNKSMNARENFSVINISKYSDCTWDLISIENYNSKMHYVKKALYNFVNTINKYVDNPSFSVTELELLVDYGRRGRGRGRGTKKVSE